MDPVYDSEDCRVLSRALSHAWNVFIRAGRLNPHNGDTALGALAYAVLEAAAGGQRDPRRLAISALALIEPHETRVRAARSWAQPVSIALHS
jgi:hypothetical protein